MVAAFLADADPALRSTLAEAPQLATILDTHLAAARDAWPAVDIAPTRFAGELARRLGSDASVERLETQHAADVYLAIACGDGVEGAIAACAKLLADEVAFAAPRTSATPAQAAEVSAQLREILFVESPTRPAAVRTFNGRGDLKSYLRVMAMRALIRAVTVGRRTVGGDDLFEHLAPAHDPELSILREQYREVVDEALRAAVASLDERSRALLRYQLIERWSVDQIGRAYDVHRATAARWVAAVRVDLGDRIRTELAARLQIAKDEVDSIVRLVKSRVDISLERVLGAAL